MQTATNNNILATDKEEKLGMKMDKSVRPK